MIDAMALDARIDAMALDRDTKHALRSRCLKLRCLEMLFTCRITPE